MTTDSVPEGLREAVSSDLRPVRPLSPAWQRTLTVAAVVAVVATTALAILKLKLRADLGSLPMWLGWGGSLLELIFGIFLVGLALRESVPGAGVPKAAARTALGTALLVQVMVGIITWLHSPGMAFGADWFARSVGCLKNDAALVLPTLAVTLWMVFRALPLRAAMAGMLGGAGAGITGDAITHVLCPMSDLRHVLVWHTGAILGFIAVGWIVGVLWQRLRWR